MWCVYLNDRTTGESIGIYASSFGSYEEAKAWADKYEMGARKAGQFFTVGWETV